MKLANVPLYLSNYSMSEMEFLPWWIRSQTIVQLFIEVSNSRSIVVATKGNKRKRSDTNHIDFGNRTHAAYHDIDLNRGWWTTEVRSDAVVVTAKQIVQQFADVAVIVALRSLPCGCFHSCSLSKTFHEIIYLLL